MSANSFQHLKSKPIFEPQEAKRFSSRATSLSNKSTEVLRSHEASKSSPRALRAAVRAATYPVPEVHPVMQKTSQVGVKSLDQNPDQWLWENGQTLSGS